jgi:hypothetical protein
MTMAVVCRKLSSGDLSSIEGVFSKGSGGVMDSMKRLCCENQSSCTGAWPYVAELNSSDVVNDACVSSNGRS